MLGDLNFSFDNILDSNGFAVALTGMTIVFVALSLITIFIAVLPRALEALRDVLPPEGEHMVGPTTSDSADQEAIAVAIGFALYTREAGALGQRGSAADARR